MKNRILASVLCVAMVATMLAGCGSKSSDSASGSTAAATKTDVKADAVDTTKVYVTPDWVQSVIDGNQDGYDNYVILDVGYGEEKDSETYGKGHIAGAQFASVTEVEDATGEVNKTGSDNFAYNLLSDADLEKNMLAHGITKDTKVIMYGADPCGVGRMAYAYLYAGVEDVKILNGGLDAYTTAGYTTVTDSVKGEAATDFGTTVPAHPEYWTSIEDANDKLANDENFKLVSIRSEDEWLGKTSGYTYMDKAGEPEGAVWGKGAETSGDVAMFVNEDGTVKDLDGLKEVWKDCDFTLDNHLAFYCGTGWRATVPFLVLYENGYADSISIYDGGWYEWLMHDDYKVQVGDPASADCQHTTVADLPTGMASAE